MASTTSLKSLSIRISTDGLSFCVYTPTAEQPYHYEHFDVKPVVSMAANLKEALQNVNILKEQYQRINVLVSTPMFTTVPTIAFDREHIEDTFNFTFYGTTSPSESTRPSHTEQQHISYNVLRRSGIAIILTEMSINYCMTTFHEHASTPLLRPSSSSSASAA